MRFSFVQDFPCPPAVLARTAREAACQAALAEAGGLDQHVERVEVLPGGGTRTRTQVSPRKELPSVIRAAVGVDRFRYVQVTDEAADGLSSAWSIEPLVLAERVRAEGTTRVVAHGEGCRQFLEGEVVIRARLVGARIEQAIVEDLGRGHARAAAVIRGFLGGAS